MSDSERIPQKSENRRTLLTRHCKSCEANLWQSRWEAAALTTCHRAVEKASNKTNLLTVIKQENRNAAFVWTTMKMPTVFHMPVPQKLNWTSRSRGRNLWGILVKIKQSSVKIWCFLEDGWTKPLILWLLVGCYHVRLLLNIMLWDL